MPVQEGDQVEIEYVGTLDSGETFDSSKQHEQNLIFKVEKDAIFDGFYEAVLGMEEEEEKEFRIEAKDAYGEYDEELVKKMPRSKFPENPAPEPGMMYMGETEQGKRVPCLIKKVEKDAIWMDFNHPLAGKPLNFQIKLISIHENE